MSWFSKAFDWVKDKGASIAKVALPIAGFAVGLVAPGIGATIGKVADKLGNKLSDITGIGDGKPGVFGIGDGLPGIMGIGTGKGKAADIKAQAEAVVKAMGDKAAAGQALTAEEQAAKARAEADIKKETGVNPLVWIAGGIAALLML